MFNVVWNVIYFWLVVLLLYKATSFVRMTKTRNWCWRNSFLLSDDGLTGFDERMCFELN